MNKVLLKSFSVCSMLAFVGQAYASESSEIKFTASITPSACSISVVGTGDGLLDFGAFSVADIKAKETEDSAILLPLIADGQFTVKSQCEAVSRVGVRVDYGTEERLSVEQPDSNLSSYAYPMDGTASSVGSISLTVTDAKASADGTEVAAEPLASVDALSWAKFGKITELPGGGNLAYFSLTDNGTNSPATAKNMEFKLSAGLHINPAAVKLGEEIKLESSIPVALVYL